MPFFVAAAVLGGISLGFGASAASKKRKAARARQQIGKISRVQQRRSFLNKFRTAQAQALVAGQASGAGLESSALRGQQASNVTQRGVALGENIEQERLLVRAESKEEDAAKLGFASDVFATGSSLFLASA
jgi:hypothetical protein